MLKLLFLIIISSPLAFSETVALREEDLPKLVFERNGRIAGRLSEVEASKARLGYLNRSFLPRIQVDVGREHTDGTPVNDRDNSYGYSSAVASVNLYNGGRDRLQENVRKANVEQSKTELEGETFGLLTEARKLYWQMIYQKEAISILESGLKLNHQNLLSAMKKIQNNLATKTDEIDFNQSEIQLEQDLRKARITLGNNMREMAALLGHSPETTYDIPSSNDHNPGHKLDEFKSNFKPELFREIRGLEALRTAAEAEAEINRRWWTPQFDLYASKANRFRTLNNTNEMDLNQGEVLGLKFTFFFDGFESRANSVSDAYRAMAFTHLKRQRKAELNTVYENAFQLYGLNHDLVHSAEQNNRMAKRYYENVWSEYMRGIKNSPDVLQAFQRVLEANLRYADIKKDYQIARAQILGLLQE